MEKHMSETFLILFILYQTGEGGVWAQLLWGQGSRDRVVLVLRECIWNASVVSLALLAFDGTDSLGIPPRQVVYLHGLHPG